MLSFVLAAALAFPELQGQFSFFESEVQRQAVRLGVPAPRVELTRAFRTYDRWAWVTKCDSCADPATGVVHIRYDVIAFFSADTLKVLALHEVLHLQKRHHLEELWAREDPAALAEQARQHARIMKVCDWAFDEQTRYAVSRDLRRWRKAWGR